MKTTTTELLEKFLLNEGEGECHDFYVDSIREEMQDVTDWKESLVWSNALKVVDNEAKELHKEATAMLKNIRDYAFKDEIEYVSTYIKNLSRLMDSICELELYVWMLSKEVTVIDVPVTLEILALDDDGVWKPASQVLGVEV